MHTQRTAGAALALVLAAAPLAAACAEDGPDAAVPSDFIEIDMTEFRFTPARVVVPVGAEVTFRFHNAGTVAHEAVFGDAAQQEAHHQQMLAMAETAETSGEEMADRDMEEMTDTTSGEEMADHDMDQMTDTTSGEEMADHDMEEMTDRSGEGMDHAGVLVLEPGESEDVVHVVDEASEILIGCHEPGHWEAGMRATVIVT